MNGTKEIAQRIVNAENNFIETVIEFSGCNNEQAEKVLNVYKKEKIVKLHLSLGRYEVKHGIFLEKNILWNAINL